MSNQSNKPSGLLTAIAIVILFLLMTLADNLFEPQGVTVIEGEVITDTIKNQK